jgi:hypothetical protein
MHDSMLRSRALAGAAIYHSASGRDGRADPFKRFKPFFIGMNAAVSAAVALLFLLMSQTDDLGRKASLSLAGVLVTSVTAICMSTGFLVYGAVSWLLCCPDGKVACG